MTATAVGTRRGGASSGARGARGAASAPNGEPAPEAARPAGTTLADLVCRRVRLLARRALDGDASATGELAAVEAQLAGAAGASLRRLADLFRIPPHERDVLECCLAYACDPSLAESFARVGGRPYVTTTLVARLFGHARARVWNPGGALAVWALVRAESAGAGEADALTVDPVVPAWLAGDLWVDRALVGIVRSLPRRVPLESWPVDALAAEVRRALAAGQAIRLVVSGDPGAGRTQLAGAVAAAAGLPPLLVDTSDIAEGDWEDAYVRLQRLAAVGGLALIWTGTNAARPWPAVVAPAPVHFVLVEPETTVRPVPLLVTERLELPEPTIAERAWLWRAAVPAAGAWPAAAIDELAARFRLGAGDILAIAAESPPTPAAAARAARACRRTVGEEMVHPVPCPFAWDDLVVPPALRGALEELAFEAAEREAVREALRDATRNGDGGARASAAECGLVALFSGAPGTGKTMAAQVIAAHLQLDLLRVDLAAVVSKYIGETAKNMNRIFAIARRRQAALLFDEADAYFARRTEVKDAHDRYANADTNHLLQLIESHRGLVLLATNRRNDMDPAFVRRLRFVLEFPLPQPEQRAALWKGALAAVAPKQWPGLSARVKALSASVELSGAQISSAALTALFLARREGRVVAFEHVVRGVDRELGKEGRPLSSQDREAWAHA